MGWDDMASCSVADLLHAMDSTKDRSERGTAPASPSYLVGSRKYPQMETVILLLILCSLLLMQISCLAPVPMMYIYYFAMHCRSCTRAETDPSPPRPHRCWPGRCGWWSVRCPTYRSSFRYLCTYDTPTSMAIFSSRESDSASSPHPG